MGALVAIAACCLVPLALGVYGVVNVLAERAKRRKESISLNYLSKEGEQSGDVEEGRGP